MNVIFHRYVDVLLLHIAGMVSWVLEMIKVGELISVSVSQSVSQ